ncbi:MAG: gamma-glutamylcyclotransferase [Hyphomicrobiales bacterium]|nr:gamma-glutamylcyclotransferase [Hyphomicrobiales bacterium]
MPATQPLLFVYGTLRDPDVLAAVLGRPYDMAGVAIARLPGHRVVFFPGRTYPALIAAAGQEAEGLALASLTLADLAMLDAFEGDEYRRTTASVIVNGIGGEADVYFPRQAIGDAAAEWSFAAWVARHKADFLSVERENVIQLRARLTG